MWINPDFKETEEPPKELTPQNVIFWSTHYKKLVVEGGDTAIGFKARRFIENNCIEYLKDEYDSSKSCYICKPIKDYNKTTYHLKWNKELNDFECDCQFNQRVHRMCSHILALYLQLKIWNYNKKNLNIGITSI
jgi:hypothetical protein